jgi:hypothetical protein
MTEIGSTLDSGITQVAVAGTRVRLTTEVEEFTAKTVVIQALGTNLGEIVVGGNEVVAAPGTQAEPKQEGIALAAKNTISIDIIDPSQIWLDATKSKDGVSYLVLLA